MMNTDEQTQWFQLGKKAGRDEVLRQLRELLDLDRCPHCEHDAHD